MVHRRRTVPGPILAPYVLVPVSYIEDNQAITRAAEEDPKRAVRARRRKGKGGEMGRTVPVPVPCVVVPIGVPIPIPWRLARAYQSRFVSDEAKGRRRRSSADLPEPVEPFEPFEFPFPFPLPVLLFPFLFPFLLPTLLFPFEPPGMSSKGDEVV
jgi:hypothetical protein